MPSTRIILLLAVSISAAAQKKQSAPPPIVPVSIGSTDAQRASDIEFELDMGEKKSVLSIHAPGWVDWKVSGAENILEINALSESAAAKLALLETFMASWVASTERTDGGIRIEFEANVEVTHRQNGNHINVDLERVKGKRRRRKRQ